VPFEPTASRFRASLNAYLLKLGLAYPMVYTTLPEDLARPARLSVELARNAQLGVWADGIDRTREWTRIGGRTHLRLHALWPKLFRRLHDVLALDKALGKLDDWMAVDPSSRDDELIVAGSTAARLHDVIEVHRDSIRMLADPSEIVVKSGATVVGATAPRRAA
jgi:hypothetical protein